MGMVPGHLAHLRAASLLGGLGAKETLKNNFFKQTLTNSWRKISSAMRRLKGKHKTSKKFISPSLWKDLSNTELVQPSHRTENEGAPRRQGLARGPQLAAGTWARTSQSCGNQPGPTSGCVARQPWLPLRFCGWELSCLVRAVSPPGPSVLVGKMGKALGSL